MQDSYTNEQVERWCQMAQDDGKLWGAMEEQQRIIELLQKKLPRLAKDFYTSFRPSGEDFAEEVIELIKGEKK